ncbi:hypothetical protein ElyMa_004244700 [Elysia marginata]|uniref:Uncharacterized protein n=1 Tax=Elysia marginata TaxID=1093978 RepID=A0AAV4GTG2_9GAST|nr:hypothetical protein ElyMa_004244700 [Elysia marginata]
MKRQGLTKHGMSYNGLPRIGMLGEICWCHMLSESVHSEGTGNISIFSSRLYHKGQRGRVEASSKTIASRPDSGIAGSSSASYASSEAAVLDGRHGSQADLLTSSLEMLEQVYQVRHGARDGMRYICNVHMMEALSSF